MKFPFIKSKAEPKPGLSGRAIRSTKAMPEHANIIRAFNGKMMRTFEAALSNNLNVDFPVSQSSANAEIFTSILGTRSRARTLDRDNPYAWAMLESMRVNVGGHEPFRLEMNLGQWTAGGEFKSETELNREIQAAWKFAGRRENCTTRGDMSRLELYLQAITGMVRDGGVLARHRELFPHNDFKYAIQPLEYDRLDHYWNGKNAINGNDIKLSVEMEAPWDRVVAFWLLTKHPGDIFVIGNLEQGYRERVAAEEMIALFDLRTRAEQTTGISRFASVIQRLHRMDQFDIAHVTAAIWASCKPFFIVQEMPTAMDYVPDHIKTMVQGMMQGAGNGSDEGDKVSNVEPGTGEVLPFGQKPFLVDPKFPIEAANDFKKDNLRAAAAGSGTPYHQIGQDLSSVNFSSGRLGENAFHDSCKILQEHFVDDYARPHFERWLKYAILTNQVSLPMSRYKEACEAAIFHGRRWPYVNPLQDVQADILAVEAGFNSRDNVIQNSERGGDVEQVNAEIASGVASDEAHDLNFTVDPTKPELEPGAPGELDTDAPSATAGSAASKKGGKQTVKKPSRARKAINRLARMNGVLIVNGEH